MIAITNIYKGKIDICGLRELPYRMIHTIYRAAWLESKARAKEAEEAEKEARKEQRKNSNNRGPKQLSSRQALEKMRGLSDSDLEDITDEMGIS